MGESAALGQRQRKGHGRVPRIGSEASRGTWESLLRWVGGNPRGAGLGSVRGMAVLLAIVLGYLCGSVPFGLVIARARKVDLRAVGSGNIGATNAARALGRGYGLLVLLLDALKATGPVLLAERYFAADPRQPWIVVAVAAAAFVGHLWPVFARFQGGKGVATALGCFVAIAPLPALCGALTWVVLFGVTRISSVGSLGAVVLFPVWLYLFSCRAAGLCADGAVSELDPVAPSRKHRPPVEPNRAAPITLGSLAWAGAGGAGLGGAVGADAALAAAGDRLPDAAVAAGGGAGGGAGAARRGGVAAHSAKRRCCGRLPIGRCCCLGGRRRCAECCWGYS
jgi:glycerol-3-phosphate acyltransferase PlsY